MKQPICFPSDKTNQAYGPAAQDYIIGDKHANSGRYTPKVVDVFLSTITIEAIDIQGVCDIVVDVVDKNKLCQCRTVTSGKVLLGYLLEQKDTSLAYLLEQKQKQLAYLLKQISIFAIDKQIDTTMFKREILSDLQQWGKSEYRKPLILRGARQVGKTSQA